MLGQMIANNEKSLEELSKDYNKKMSRGMSWEIFKAVMKNCILSMVRFFIYIIGCVPWQTNKWNKKDRIELKNKGLFQNMLAKQKSNENLLAA